jgi:hypothetical protein
MPEFGFGDLVRLSGLTPGELLSLQRARVIVPSARESTGRGTHHRFTALDALAAKVASALKPYRIPSRQTKAIVTQVIHTVTRTNPDAEVLIVALAHGSVEATLAWSGSRDQLMRGVPSPSVTRRLPVAVFIQLDVLRSELADAMTSLV